MPRKEAKLLGRTLTFDARPDRLDLRDLPYRPPVASLPPSAPSDDTIAAVLPAYLESKLVLDQKSEGACTGFGLAAVINYLGWRSAYEHNETMGPDALVSTRMLYHLARFYDEWPGEDYEGSSCRGALKGWQRHGVCLESLWPYKDGEFVRPLKGWENDAVTRPLGVYYRVQRDSVVDMQAAVYHAGAIYVSATVHDGWNLRGSGKGRLLGHRSLPVIKPGKKVLGGHAFAIVGYNETGFVVQNSWGDAWGWSGFGVLPYDDWVEHGSDAWVVALGAPVAHGAPAITAGKAARSPQHYVRRSGRRAGAGELPNWVGAMADPLRDRKDVWDAQSAYWHSLVTGNDGRIINRLPQVENDRDNIKFVALEQPKQWFIDHAGDGPWRLAIYAHGGLNSEQDSVNRIRVLGPNFEANGIYPLFVTWKSGWKETIANMINDSVREFFGELPPPKKGIADSVIEAADRSLETICRHMLVRSMWSEMKENVAQSEKDGRGIDELAAQLKALHAAAGGRMEIHLMGHSAGSFVCGRLLSEFADVQLAAESCTLFAPACDLNFAMQHYAPAIDGGRLPRKRFHIHVLSDQRELDDTVGPYRKSLLYLVSRALERRHKTPILGMATVFDPAYISTEFWHNQTKPVIETWQNFFWHGKAPPREFSAAAKEARFDTLSLLHAKQVNTGAGMEKSTHGCFDNSITHIGDAISQMRGGALLKRIGPLSY